MINFRPQQSIIGEKVIMSFRIRTHTCGELSEQNVGDKVVLNGWVDRRRDLGGLIFIWLRDRYGITQIVFEPDINKDSYELAKKLRSEFVSSRAPETERGLLARAESLGFPCHSGIKG